MAWSLRAVLSQKNSPLCTDVDKLETLDIMT